ncbi:hypothetical protein LCGC14_0469780 [marine sediment metagenome]|uniref:NAD/GMP synthase domain-containing protein n=1 Tax=marine sediment metagenome TaxID=412755 RepID=A0A0F9VLG7_9ZZZZ
MAILNLEKTEKHIVDWIKNYAESAGIKTLVVGLSGGVDSALVALLCKKTGLPTICVNMPCHSSNSAYDRANDFAKEFNLDMMKVNLSYVHESVYRQIASTSYEFPTISKEGLNNPIAVGGLRSCLRAPVLSYLALVSKGIIMGTGNRSEDHLTRYFQKFGDGCVDICPIADLFKGEVYELFAYTAGLEIASRRLARRPPPPTPPTSGELIATGSPAAAAIYNAIPTADLWGPDAGHEDEDELGISYDEIEWADRQNTSTGTAWSKDKIGVPIVTDKGDPTRHRAWQSYTGRQREVIAKMHAIEKATRHKYNPNLPVCQVRKENGLVR